MADTACPDCGGSTISRSAKYPRCCVDCMKVRRREAYLRWKERHPGRERELLRAYKARNREKIRAAGRIVIERDMACQDCGEAFTRDGNRGPIPKWCSDCKTARMLAQSTEYRRRHPEKVLVLAKRGNARRRAAARDIAADKVERLVVFERDGWICQLCETPVLRGVFRWPAPWSASLDHVLPLSRGGEHTYANTQLAHLRCNLRKNNKVQAVA